MFNKGEYVGHLEPPIDETLQTPNQYSPSTHSITTKKMIAEKVKPDNFQPPWHDLNPDIETKLKEMLREYTSQFAQDETSNGTTPLTEMTIDTGNSELASQKPYPIAMKHYQLVKDEINKLPNSKIYNRKSV